MNWSHRTILIVEDERSMCDLIAHIFRREGAQTKCAYNGESGLRWHVKHHADLVVLDIMLPGMNGIEVLKRVRRVSDVPLIILTADNRRELLLEALKLGADDFLTKPFQVDELLARSSAVLRRAQINNDPVPVLRYDDGILTINQEKREVSAAGARIRLTRTEFNLLSYLIRYAGLVRTYDQILNDVWGDEYEGSADNVHVFISQLRKKIELNPKKPRYILNEHGVGYRFRK